MKRTFWLKRETGAARLLETNAGMELWVPRSVCPRMLKFPPNPDGKVPVELEIEDWWWQKNGVETKEQQHGQGKLKL
jgi:hypothetical protein